uniref:BAP29/BAP31 transmembrane domain-containing protein n=1 Tax=Panagrolaimus sp. ES5 TaxID=591445 RepID=A0AC34FEJ6_9BILA
MYSRLIEIISSFGLFVVSLVGLFLDVEKMNSILRWVAPFEKSVPKNAAYFWLSFFAVKNLVFVILNLWFLMVVWRYIKYFCKDLKNELQSDMSTTVIHENQTSGLQATTKNDSNSGPQKDKSKMSTTSITETQPTSITEEQGF